MNKIRVYIASPYSIGDKVENVRRSLEVSDRLMNKGFVPYAPLLNHFQNEMFPRPEFDWLNFDISWLCVCDVVLRLPGRSCGADKEVSVAKEKNIPVFYSIKELLKWSNMQNQTPW
jgi:hypothetical protein